MVFYHRIAYLWIPSERIYQTRTVHHNQSIFKWSNIRDSILLNIKRASAVTEDLSIYTTRCLLLVFTPYQASIPSFYNNFKVFLNVFIGKDNQPANLLVNTLETRVTCLNINSLDELVIGWSTPRNTDNQVIIHEILLQLLALFITSWWLFECYAVWIECTIMETLFFSKAVVSKLGCNIPLINLFLLLSLQKHISILFMIEANLITEHA